MKKLYRTTLIAGVLAFGVAACGDDVQVVDPEPTPPPALSVTLTPGQLTLQEGASGNLTVGVTGGDAAAEAQVSCESSDTGVATVSASGDVCAVTAVAAGTATVTARVTKGSQTSSAGAAVTVEAPAPEPEVEAATVSINRVLKGDATADLDNAAGQLDVVLNLQRNDETVQAVVLFVDDTEVARQTFSRAELDEIAAAIEEDAEVAEATEQITLSFKTGFYEIVGGEAVVRTPNGDYSLSAEAVVAEGESRASDALPITIRNADGFHVESSWEGNQALSAAGRLWIGGPDFEITVNPVPVMYSGRTITSMTLNLAQFNVADPGAVERCTAAGQTDTAGPFEFGCSGVEADSIAPRLTSIVEPGDTGPTIGIDGSGILNLAARGTDHQFPARIDVRAPTFGDTAFGIVQDPATRNTGNWVNAAYRFAQGFDTNQVADGGVGRPQAVADGVQFAVSTGTTTATAFWVGGFGSTAGDVTRDDAALEETVTNTELHAWARVEDRLGNATFIRQQAEVDALHPARTFGYDITAPTLAIAEGNDAFGQLNERYVFVNEFGEEDGYDIDGTDNLAGFHPDFAARHALVTVRGELNAAGGIERAALVGTAPVAGPFEAVRDDAPMATLAAVTFGDFFDTQTRVRFQLGPVGDRNVLPGNITLPAALTLQGDAAPRARYYIYQVRLQDQAGNVTKDYRAVYLNNNSQPVIENLENPSVFDGNATFTASQVRDSVEVLEGSLEIQYSNIGPFGGSIIWERPTSELTSVLRMNARIADGELFNDVIYRPQRNVEFPTGFADLGLDFIRNIQRLNPEDEIPEIALPDTVRARVFSGFGANVGNLSHTSDIPAFGGVSQIVERAIEPEEVAGPGFYFRSLSTSATAPAASWSFGIVDGSAANCGAEYCVRAIGPRSTFTNPFVGGPVLIAWADSEGNRSGVTQTTELGRFENVPTGTRLKWRVMTLAEPNFAGANPTRDSGDDRIYEWTFDLPEDVNPGELEGRLLLAAIGVRPDGDALYTEFGNAFQVQFVGAPYEVDRQRDVTLPIEHTIFSVGGEFTVESCAFSDSEGAPRTFPPTGLSIEAVGNTCVVSAGDNAEVGEYAVQATATQNGASATIQTSVTVLAGEFAVGVSFQNDAFTDGPFVPLSGTQEFVFPVSFTGVGGIAQGQCAVTDAQGNEVDVNDFTAQYSGTPRACHVTIPSNEDLVGEGYTLTFIAQEDGTEAEATATITFNILEPLTVSLDEATLTIDRDGSAEFKLVDERPAGQGDSRVLTCDVGNRLPSGITHEGNNDTGICKVDVDRFFKPYGGGSSNFDIQVQAGDHSRTVTATVVVPEHPEFDPVVEEAGTAEAPRLIPQGETVTFRIVGSQGFGINITASSQIEVNPNDENITAQVTQDNDERPVIRVTPQAEGQLGLKTITVTLVEEGPEGTRAEKAVTLRIQVTDDQTGQGTIDG